MESPCRRTGCFAVIVFFAAVVLSGCVKQLPAPERAAPGTAAGNVEAKKIIVAKVNNAELSMESLVKMMNRLPEKTGGVPESLEERRKRALDSLVLLELAYQRANERGFLVDPAKIDLSISNFINNTGGEKEYAEYLKSNNVTEADLRSEIERGLAIEQIYAKEVIDSVSIPEQELRQEYEKGREQLIRPEKVSIVDVYVFKNEGKKSKAKAGKLLRMIKADAGRDPWKLVLDGTFTVRKLLVRSERQKELYEAAKKLKPQQFSGVIEASDGLHIIKLEEYSAERKLTFQEAKAKIEATVKGPALEKRTREWEQELKQGAKIEILDSGLQDPQS